MKKRETKWQDKAMELVHRTGISAASYCRTVGKRGALLAAEAAGVVVGTELVIFWWAHTAWADRFAGVGILLLTFLAGTLGVWTSQRARVSAEAAPAKPIQIWINGKPSPRAFQTRGQVEVAKDVFSCLVNLGYSAEQAQRAVTAIPVDRSITFDEAFQIVTKALGGQTAVRRP
jgi:hypothetical protein